VWYVVPNCEQQKIVNDNHSCDLFFLCASEPSAIQTIGWGRLLIQVNGGMPFVIIVVVVVVVIVIVIGTTLHLLF
jgi:hypothetical protein